MNTVKDEFFDGQFRVMAGTTSLSEFWLGSHLFQVVM